VERLVQSYQQYRREGGTLPLVVAGHRIREYLQSKRVCNSSLAGIHFTGFIPHADMHLVYSLAEFFILSTLYESFGLPIVEAMAVGCPCIVPSTGACPEVAGGAARLVDPRSVGAMARGMRELEDSPDTLAALRAAGLKRVQVFTWRDTAARTLAAFDSVVPPPDEFSS
jgi:glycosyltransferase involved in cell wall biosynthesis